MLAILFTLTALSDAEPPAPKFKAEFRKTDDSFASSQDKSVIVWKITSKSGIGGATVTQTTGAAPKKLVIRFVGMRSLESFQCTNGTTEVTGQLDRGKKTETFFDAEGKSGADPKTAAASLVIEKKGDDVEVVLTMTKPQKKWTLSWIDAYRK